MKKKIIVVGVLAGAAALTGLAGSAYAEGGTTVPKPGKTTGPIGKPLAVSCIGTAGPGKGVPGKGVPGRALTGKGGEVAVDGKTGGKETGVKGTGVKGTGVKPPPLPPAGRTVWKTGGGGRALPAPPAGAKALPGGPVAVFDDGKGTLKIKPPKGVRCSVSDPGTLPPLGGKPPVATRTAPK
jgi:hypothetical protein